MLFKKDIEPRCAYCACGAPLEDGAYVCVYFDDYLMLRSSDELPTGYIRYTTTEEKTMLH